MDGIKDNHDSEFLHHRSSFTRIARVDLPRFNLVRYSGVPAPSSGLRRRIIPAKPEDKLHRCKHSIKYSGKADNSNPDGYERRYAWAELLKRVYSVDALKCDRCGGKMRILCAIHQPSLKASADKPARCKGGD
jgi:hypothetical protein